MVVIVIDNAPTKLRGTLTRWLLETKPGVFVGKVSAMVREKLWEKVCEDRRQTGALMLYSADTEQGFRIEMIGDPKRAVTDIDGIQLIKTQKI